MSKLKIAMLLTSATLVLEDARQAVAQCIMELLAGTSRDLGVSIGIVEPGSEKLAQPSFY